MSACPHCGASLQTPLVCEDCHALLPIEDDTSPFEILGVTQGWSVDVEALDRSLLRLTRLTHPDFHGTSGEPARTLAEGNTALLNAAHATLSDDVARAEWLLAAMGAPSAEEERQMPQEFLLEVLEWNETLEEARGAQPGAPARLALVSLRAELEARRSKALVALGEQLNDATDSDPIALRRELNSVRYLDRTLSELTALTLEQASQRGTSHA